MSRRIFIKDKDGETIGPRRYYSSIAGRAGVKPRLAKKANKLIDADEATWRATLQIKDVLLFGDGLFESWYKHHRIIVKLLNNFGTRRSCSRGLKEAFTCAREFYWHRQSQGFE